MDFAEFLHNLLRLQPRAYSFKLPDCLLIFLIIQLKLRYFFLAFPDRGFLTLNRKPCGTHSVFLGIFTRGSGFLPRFFHQFSFLLFCFIHINRLSAKGTHEVMKKGLSLD